jgi:hypothetical protein
LIPANTAVLVKVAGPKPQSVLIRQEDSLMVNQELIKSDQLPFRSWKTIYLDSNTLKAYEAEAKRLGFGIFQRCDDGAEETLVAEFEPLEFDAETQWGDDGGKQVVKQKERLAQGPPNNPGDIKGCSDFWIL